ncbi:Protein phosphatase 2C family protein [Forsythia ovata]|uniref:Protein phosphatase 2C family protein n=1 Tax=Forsythia ovata TaxID=205694 RepID=A0ABD1VEB3_9LAMI
MEKFQIAAFLGVFLGAIRCLAYGISVSCMMAYEEGGAPAVFSSPECPQWVLAAESSRNSSRNCHFATFQGRREYQEDRITCNLDMKIPYKHKTLRAGKNGPEEATVGIAAVFDGHGGREASEMASEKLADYLVLHTMFNSYNQAVPRNGENNDVDTGCFTQTSSQGVPPVIDRSIYGILKEGLLRTIQDIDSEFSQEALEKGYTSGSTLTVLLLVEGRFLIANVGDSKAILCSRKIRSHNETVEALHTEELTRDHHPDREDEKARIEAAGGFVHVWGVPRVNGILAMSRAIGDVFLKRYGVIAVPDVTGWRPLTSEDIYLVVASDGLFETLTPQNVCDLLHNKASEVSSECLLSSSLADCIIRTAFKRGSTDNLSVILIPWKPPIKQMTGAAAAQQLQ